MKYRYFELFGVIGGGDEISIYSPDERELATIPFWDGRDSDPERWEEALVNAQLIVDALNAYKPHRRWLAGIKRRLKLSA